MNKATQWIERFYDIILSYTGVGDDSIVGEGWGCGSEKTYYNSWHICKTFQTQIIHHQFWLLDPQCPNMWRVPDNTTPLAKEWNIPSTQVVGSKPLGSRRTLILGHRAPSTPNIQRRFVCCWSISKHRHRRNVMSYRFKSLLKLFSLLWLFSEKNVEIVMIMVVGWNTETQRWNQR